jgi:diamine N-acetyltransferase
MTAPHYVLFGRTGLGDIDYRDRRANFGLEIGEADYRGRGYGTETIRLMLDYAFTALGLHNVALETWEYNRAGQRAYTKAGFREIGRRRQAKFMAGKLWDIVYMDCLSTEFASPVLGQILVPDELRLQGEPEQR